ncbi:hypothetical protein [Paenibacillus sp. CF384]|uniref:hypothetical protein n=1 Tax=Paenibacillus sp. CF384 TaxID=1884382 RepID=UPI000897D96C|nr:hypothetical protein [Paenibacillus sp. CF384]SDW10824.1 hypothetical protein SAMN05518855_1001289 [Paenibacillus sp. CF384]
MLLKKTKIVGIALTAIMAIGGTSAFAATKVATLTVAKGVNLNEVIAKSHQGNAKDLKVAGTIQLSELKQMTGKTTAPGQSNPTSLSIADTKSIDSDEIIGSANAGTLTVTKVIPLEDLTGKTQAAK